MILLHTLLYVTLAAIQGHPETPQGPRTVAEGRQPQAAVDKDGTVWLTYARDNTIWLRSSTDGGETFSREQKVAKVTAMDVGMRRGPRIAATDGALIVTCIAGEQARGRDGDLLLWRSTDGGKSWSAPRELNSVKGAAREGLQATAAAGKYVAVVWLDMRDKGTTLYGTFSNDGGKTFSPDRMLYASPDGTICECCAPQVAVDETGRVAVLFRNALDGNRDMYLMKSTDGGASFSPARQQGEGHWLIQACPMDGGAVTILGDEVVMVWRREKELYLTREGMDDPSLAPSREQQFWGGQNAALAEGPDSWHAVFVGDHGGITYQYRHTSGAGGGSSSFHAPTPPEQDPVVVWVANRGAMWFWEWEGQVKARLRELAEQNEKPGQ